MTVAKGKNEKDQMLAEYLARFYSDPLGYVMFMFPWNTDPSIQMVELREPWASRFPKCKYGPDEWACEFLDELGRQVRLRRFDGRKAVAPIQFSTASGHGIGKSTLTAWLIKWIMDTRPFSKGTVTAGTDTQLRTKTWAELGKWHKMSLTEHWYDWNTGRGSMSFVHRAFPERWMCTAQTCREENSESFAGQHAASATSFYIFDEASQIPDKIYDVREGGLTDGEPMTFDFGNPTRKSGRFFENTAGRFKGNYIVRQIDSRSVQVSNKELIARWIKDHGIDSDFVRVRVLGQFPKVGSVQFIPNDLVEEAQRRDLALNRTDALVIGVDVARFGDDETVIYPRIGMDARSFAPKPQAGRYNGLDGPQVAGKVIQMVTYFRELGREPSAIFIDAGGVGVSVIDHLRHLHYSPMGINFGGSPVDGNTYRFKVDEMWGKLKDALKMGLALPADAQELKTQLTQREFGYTLLGNKINLESKADMKERLGEGGYSSPDIADALALTFAAEVAPMVAPGTHTAPRQTVHDYDPHAEAL